jgi:ATP-binding cassette subfamily B (MDR/TAP) protein 1
MAIVQGAVAAGMWFSFAPNMAQAAGAANRILSLRTHKSTAPPVYKPVAPASGGVSIEFQNVYFSYKSREVPVLSNLNIKVLPGQFAALVGASGCGKSTSISLLERFYDATSGHVLFNEQDITSLDPKEYRKQVSLVSQEPTLYEGSIRENVALSVESATNEEIEAACRDAQIHEFIISLPEGYNTRLGPKGMSLSGGQKQRLSLARALLRKPKLLLLDEATSSLDSESEKLVQEAIERAADEGGRTVIAVAHRLATIQKADVIFVLGSGKVLEKGDHQGLLRKKGIYYQMVSLIPRMKLLEVQKTNNESVSSSGSRSVGGYSLGPVLTSSPLRTWVGSHFLFVIWYKSANPTHVPAWTLSLYLFTYHFPSFKTIATSLPTSFRPYTFVA